LPCRDTVVCQTRRRLLERTLLNQAVGAKSEVKTIANLYLRLLYFFKSPTIALNGANGTSDIEHVAIGNRAGRR
jgi:hypothetical protein